MAWRPGRHLIEGELDNTERGKVSGWMRFAGMETRVVLDLEGDFHRDIRGATIRFAGDAVEADAGQFMEGFCPRQSGKAGDITAGLPPNDYGDRPYIEWYSEQNGRVVLEPEPENVRVVGTPLPATATEPISRDEQHRHMANYLAGLSQRLGVSAMTMLSPPGTEGVVPMTHWVMRDDRIIGEARPIEALDEWTTLAHLRVGPSTCSLTGVGTVPSRQLRAKADLN